MKSYTKFIHVLVAVLDCEIEAIYDGQQVKGGLLIVNLKELTLNQCLAVVIVVIIVIVCILSQVTDYLIACGTICDFYIA